MDGGITGRSALDGDDVYAMAELFERVLHVQTQRASS
jgi:hypothetical protein